MMSDPSTIDIVAHDPETGKLLLVMTEHRPWNQTMNAEFRAKLNTYVHYLRSEQFAKDHPGLKPSDVIVKLDCAHVPGSNTLAFFEQVRGELAQQGIELRHEVIRLPSGLLSRATASRPARLRINWIHWLRYDPDARLFLICLALSILGIFCALYFSAWHWIWAIFFLLLPLLAWIRWTIHFRTGNAEPGKVVSLDPVLFAVATDLTKGIGSFPALKIVQSKRLPHIYRGSLAIGFRLATVCMYEFSKADSPSWADVHPMPAEYVTSNKKKIAKVMQLFSQEDWDKLDRFLKQVPLPYAPGLYRIDEKQER